MTQAVESLKNLHFNGLLLSYKRTEESYFMTLEKDAKFEEKLTFSLENDMRNLENFHQSTEKTQKWDFYLVILSKAENIKA